MILIVFIKPVTELSCPLWKRSAYVTLLHPFIQVFPLIVSSLHTQAASKHSQVRPEGILFSSALHSVCENVALPAARHIAQGNTAAWKADTVPLPAARRASAAVQDVSFQLLEQVRARAGIWHRNWIECCAAASFTQFLQRRGRYCRAQRSRRRGYAHALSISLVFK